MRLDFNISRLGKSDLFHEKRKQFGRPGPLKLAAAAALACLAMPHSSALASILTNVFTASSTSPDVTTDQTGQAVSFTSLGNMNLATNASIPNGPFSSIVGDAVGTFTTNGTNLSNGVTTSDSGNSVYAAFQYDSNGFRLIGNVTISSTGAYSQMNVIGVTPSGSVLGGEGRSSKNSSTTGILGNETWLSTPTSPGSATATDTYLGIFNSSTEYSATTVSFPATTETASYQTGVALSGGYAVGTSTQYAGDGNSAIGQVLSQTLFHGTVVGTNYVANSTTDGQFAWIQTATSSATQIGLYGSGNSYAYSTPASLNNGVSTPIGTYYGDGVTGVNANGIAIGSAAAYSNATAAPNTSLGTDVWMYNGTTTVPIGMYNSGQTLSLANYSGAAISTYNFYSSPTSNVGSTSATSQYRSSTLYFVNPSGVIAGNSSYYPVGATSTSAQGSVAYTYNAGTYTPLAFTTSNFTSATYPLPAGVASFVNSGSSSTVGQINSIPVAINAAGTVTGTQTVYVGQGYSNSSAGTAYSYTQAGRAAWSATPAGVLTQIGLYNQGPTSLFTPSGAANTGYTANFDVHQNPSTYGTYQDVPQFINASGLIAGNSQRYSSTGASLGVDAWVYDPSAGPNGTTYAVDPTDENNKTYVFESVDYLSDNGFAIGQYKTSSSGALSTYIWSDAAPTTSFTPLNGVDVTNLTADGFADLIHSYYVDPTGTITYETAGATSTSSTVTGLVTVVPEPTSLSLVALASVALLGRRRRRVS